MRAAVWLEIRPGLRGRFVQGDVGWTLAELASEAAWREARADSELAQPSSQDRRIAFTTADQAASYFATMERIGEAARGMMATRRVPVVTLLVVVAATAAIAASPALERCRAKWPDDYRMQEHCVEQQAKAARNTKERYLSPQPTADSPEGRILAGCVSKWTDEHGADFRMVEYCLDQQHRAREKLQRLER